MLDLCIRVMTKQGFYSGFQIVMVIFPEICHVGITSQTLRFVFRLSKCFSQLTCIKSFIILELELLESHCLSSFLLELQCSILPRFCAIVAFFVSFIT